MYTNIELKTKYLYKINENKNSHGCTGRDLVLYIKTEVTSLIHV